MKRRYLIILGMLTLLLTSAVGNNTPPHEELEQGNGTKVIADLTPHGRLVITHEDNFTAWSGSGTPEEPYVISGLNITLNDTCVSVSNTESYFVIRDSFFHYIGAINIPAIWFFNANNSRIENCTIYGFRASIYHEYSHNSNITRNFLHGGIITHTPAVRITHNIITLDELDNNKAIRILSGSDNALVFNNSIDGHLVHDFATGVEILSANNVTVYKNFITGCKTSAITFQLSHFGNITGNICTENGIGIVVDMSNHVLVEDNVARDGSSGISVIADNCTVISNGFFRNSACGVTVSGHDNTFYGNYIGFNLEGWQGLEVDAVNYWDDGVSVGNYWSDYDGVGTYTIPGNQGGIDHYPMMFENSVIDHPSDITYEFNDASQGLSWISNGTSPESYELARDGELISSNIWDGSRLVFPLLGHAVGLYQFELTTFFESGMSVSDIVGVQVLASSGPVIVLEHVSGMENETVEVSADVTDISGIQEVFLSYSANGSAWINLTMNESGGHWAASIPGDLAKTVIEYRVYASDTLGNWAVSDIKSYTVEGASTHTTTSGGEGAPVLLAVYLIAGAVTVIVLLVAVVAIKRR